MKTVLVFKAQDIFMRDAIINKLRENDIEPFGGDTSVNVVYPNTPNLYLGGVSALFEGYRILVNEEDAEAASALIQEVLNEIESSGGNALSSAAGSYEAEASAADSNAKSNSEISNEKLSRNYVKYFYFMSLISVFLPVITVPFALYNFYKAVQTKQSLVFWKTIVSFLLLIVSMIEGVFLFYK